MQILAGLETEYGLYIEGDGAENQVEHSAALVRNSSHGRPFLWDYRFETPRQDLRGYTVSQLAVDPQDAAFDLGKPSWDQETRSDRILSNGARFYNDHGHPEYSTPECFTLDALVTHDVAGEHHVQRAAEAYQDHTGKVVRAYKNNLDFHGACYGTHENFLVPRTFDVSDLSKAVIPVLLARTFLCGAGRAGFEKGHLKASFQVSQRADFFSDALSVDTLYRRPIFNTRDEPHADPSKWIRLHVIAGDANINPSATKLKVGLVKLCLSLLEEGRWAGWEVAQPWKVFQTVSRDLQGTACFETSVGTTCSREILERLCDLGDKLDQPTDDDLWTIGQTRLLLHGSQDVWLAHVDWAAKRHIFDMLELPPDSPDLVAYDLEYSNIDRTTSLYAAFQDTLGRPHDLDADLIEKAIQTSLEPTRARARGLATAFPELKKAGWRSLTLLLGDRLESVELDPLGDYSSLGSDLSPGDFLRVCREIAPSL